MKIASDQNRVVGGRFSPKLRFRIGFSLSSFCIVSAMVLVACGGSSGSGKQIKNIQIDIQADWEYTNPPSGRGTFILKGALVQGDLAGTLHLSEENGTVLYDGSVTGELVQRKLTALGWCELDFTTADGEFFISSSEINYGSSHVDDFCPCCDIDADMIADGHVINWNAGDEIYGTWSVKEMP